jgi:hypothetical protein
MGVRPKSKIFPNHTSETRRPSLWDVFCYQGFFTSKGRLKREPSASLCCKHKEA